MKLLVVDDDRAIRDLAGTALRGGDYDVTVASNGDEAVARLDGGFDIVVTDLDMPGSVNGLQLTQRVRRGSSADVIIMTGYPDLSTAIQAVREGAYDYLVKPFSPDTLKMAVDRCAAARRLSKELERERALRAELNQAYVELSQMQKVRDLFGQFITPEVAAFVLAHPNDFWARGERREVTVLFADIRGFTPYAARVDPETAVRTLNQLFEVLVGAVQEQGGVVNKFLGDGLMAVFGAPCALPGHAAAAVRAAVKARALLSFSAPLEREEDRLGVGFALNSGDVLAGCLGARDRTEYSVIGSPVNLAARIEKICQAGDILLGPDTARLGGEAFELESRGPVRLPGFSEPIDIASVLGPKAGAFC